MRGWCDEAGLSQCSSHGLRKAAAVVLAESGASASELMAIFGGANLKTAQIYVEKANKRRMTANAFERRERSIESGSVPLSQTQNSNETNEEKSDA
jgi:site-specific recombinase XerD